MKVSRRKSRILAFQALFSWEASESTLEDLLTFSWSYKDSDVLEESPVLESEAAKDEKLFASLLVSGTIDRITEIDQLITEHLSDNWSIDRINKVALAILRIAIYELKFQPDSVAKIVIDEAVNIAKQFGADDSYKFINAILDKLGNNE
ncbi:MAG: transcription antitermination factor NusB [Treponema sp.]|nr:transcription antitermination factor NusB [Treponema sp.]MBQ8777087.1 transcription antitermination factor NusB [Treponema sp.]